MSNISALRECHVVAEEAHSLFARELSDLCRKHGVGLTGEPTVFLLEHEDYAYDYGVIDDRLIWGCGT